MKKLALLFGALSLVSSVAYAKEVVPVVEEVVVVEEAPVYTMAPASALKVTNFGQSLEIDNNSRRHERGIDGVDSDGLNVGSTMLGTSLGLAYEDWTFDIFARKAWNVKTPDHGIHSDGSFRIDMTAMKHYDNFAVGAKWRQESDYDKYYLKGEYSYDMFSGNIDVAYQANNAADVDDNWYIEAEPIRVTYAGVGLGYYVEWDKTIGHEDQYKGSIRHQVRLYSPTWQVTDKLGLSAEYRYQFSEKYNYRANDNGVKPMWAENNKHIAVLNAEYQVTDALSVSGYYEYDFNKFELHNKEEGYKLNDSYYGEFGIGWNYAF